LYFLFIFLIFQSIPLVNQQLTEGYMLKLH
jgi:hypothetical protein